MTETNRERKPLILNAFAMGCSGHQSPGLWKHPDDKSHEFGTIEYWTNLAQICERGKFNAIFIADVLGGYDVYNGPRNLTAAAASGAQWPVNEPSAVVSAMAAVTKNISFAITFSTISEAPYHFARRLATLDHLTNGRVGWNIVSSYLDSAARNVLNGEDLPPHDERYLRAQEYLEIVYQLFLSSWRDDALKLDRTSGIFSDPNLIRQIDYEGKFFKVPGPSINSPTPQRLPVILQAGASKAGLEYAARNAEAVFVSGLTPESLAYKITELKELARKFDRNADDIKTVQMLTPILGKTHQEALEKYQEYQSYADPEGAQALFSGWTGIDIGQYDWDQELDHVESNAVRSFAERWTKKLPGEDDSVKKSREYIAKQIGVGGAGVVIYGTPEEVADEIERWVDVSGVDGFNFAYAVSPGTFEDIVDLLVPELRKRGLVWDDYPKEKLTFRQSLFGTEGPELTFLNKNHPAYGLRWRSGETKEEFEVRVKEVIKKNFSFH